ncbi:hypothetical protein LIER_02279 [Lithospermum erythrorhizon]|uniref:Putative plant transposon protein domain-containing protein n=1 Tax=Lithospermum erythrorhizon TaxID=34254 RepID=A0AAV3NQ45_LITER
MLNTLKERAKAQEAARRAQAELGKPVPLQVIPPPVMSPVEETQQSPVVLEITSDEGEPSNMQDVPRSPTVKDSGKDSHPSSEFFENSDNVEGQDKPSDTLRPEPEPNFDEDKPIEVEVSDDDVEVNPPVKPPSNESRHKIDDTHPMIINKHYGFKDEGSTGATLKLGDIIEELTGGALKVWPAKGQLQASSLSLRYVVLHKASIDNLVPTSNNTNVVEILARMLFVMGSEHELNVGKIIFDQVVDHAKSGAKLKPIGFPSLIYSLLITQHPDVLRKEDGTGEDAKSLTISDKLMKGKHVVDVNVSASESSEPVPEGNAAALLLKVYEDELKLVEAEIQAKTIRASDLRAKIGALRVRVNPSVNTPAGTFTSGDGPSSSRM